MKEVSDIDIWAEQHLHGNTPQLSELGFGKKKKKGWQKLNYNMLWLINNWAGLQVNLK